jgi:electron transfer flavoprotein-quinone oxidoreductase
VEQVYPDFRTSASLERAITSHRVVMLGDGRSVALEFAGGDTTQAPHNAFSVLRARFDPWMARRAEDAGATLITGATVDALLVVDGRVTGIRSGPDEFRADVVVVAEGTRSLLLKAAGLREEFSPHDVSLGVKEVVALPAAVIEERFLYTNMDSLSLGVVLKLNSLYQRGRRPHEIMDEFKSHPYIRRLIAGGEVVEYITLTAGLNPTDLLVRIC